MYVTSPFGDVTDVDQWPAMIDWLMDQHVRFKRGNSSDRGPGSPAERNCARGQASEPYSPSLPDRPSIAARVVASLACP